MPAAARKGDMCSGHDGFPPRPNDEGSGDVYINGIEAHRQGDHWVTHCDDDTCHDSVEAVGRPNVYINNKQATAIGDQIACGSVIAEGSNNVFFGDA